MWALSVAVRSRYLYPLAVANMGRVVGFVSVIVCGLVSLDGHSGWLRLGIWARDIPEFPVRKVRLDLPYLTMVRNEAFSKRALVGHARLAGRFEKVFCSDSCCEMVGSAVMVKSNCMYLRGWVWRRYNLIRPICRSEHSALHEFLEDAQSQVGAKDLV